MLDRLLNINHERIAVAELFGAIGSASKTAEYIRMLRGVEENNRIRALVVDIDSPGGAVGASENLYRAIGRIAAKKPAIAFVSGLGASGGYMAACGATKIVALPSAIVGSIGVISLRPTLYDLLEKLGVRMDVTKAGRLKDMSYPFREPTPEEREKDQALVNSFYERFVAMVAEARKLPPERVRELATGEIFTAEQAKEHGLVDDLGDLDDAIDTAKSMAKLAERKVTYVRPHRGLRDRLLANSASSFGEMVVSAIEGRLREGRIEYR